MKLPRNWQSMTDEQKRQWIEANDISVNDRRKIDIDVTVDSEVMKQALKRQNELEQELETVTSEKESLESKLTIIAEKSLAQKRDYYRQKGYTGSLETLEDIRNAREWEKGRDPVGKGSSGSLRLTPAQTGQEQGFDSEEELVEFLVDQKHMGSPEERKQAQAVLDELYRKTFNAMKEGKINRTVIYDENKPEFKGKPSIIMKALRKNNERLRKKAMERRGN